MIFSRYRPVSHFIAPHSWSNDPCGAVYVPESQEYLLCYQWNPGTVEGGNCAWGMAKSKDLVAWEDCIPAIWNGTSYDSLGVFSGSIVSRLFKGKRVLYLFYTSVSSLPIHWSKPYIRGCESQSVAISTDWGKTWVRHKSNPLLSLPPKGDATTGWRDPFVTRSTSLSNLLGLRQDTEYMMIASGERQHGPQLHLYKSDSLASTSWEYVSAVLDVKTHDYVSHRSDLKWGINFECASFFSMGETDYIVVGIEEGEGNSHHNGHYNLWMSGKFVLNKAGLPVFLISGYGQLDHGVLYAAHIFKDAQNRLVQVGWADETANKFLVHEQGWAGCLAHPREIFKIVRPLQQCAVTWPEWQLDKMAGTMTTLGIRPTPQVGALRTGPSLSGRPMLEAFKCFRSKNFEIQATFSDVHGTETFIFNVLQSPHTTEVTTLIFDLERQQILVDRSQSSLKQLGTAVPDVGHLRLLPGEDLSIRVFVDVSVIEVYANDRFALTSRVYPSLDTSTTVSYDFGKFDERKVKLECWSQLNNAWPARALGQNLLPELHPLYGRLG